MINKTALLIFSAILVSGCATNKLAKKEVKEIYVISEEKVRLAAPEEREMIESADFKATQSKVIECRE